jgi:hypothetical protein
VCFQIPTHGQVYQNSVVYYNKLLIQALNRYKIKLLQYVSVLFPQNLLISC